MRKLAICCLIGLMCVPLSCRRQDVRVAAIYVPGMNSQACAERVMAAVGREQNIARESMELDLTSRTLLIHYDSVRHSLKNLEYSIARAGFAANDIPADETARNALPPDCR
ncbi:MAG: heavy metal-associated domain-containing protein [Verrucomicrobia bacterium]|nr:heavy metal-associated domain-containing protein [Verrucomicrobiota bacterium]